MKDAGDSAAAVYIRRERLLVFLYISCVMLSLSREIYRRWSAMLDHYAGGNFSGTVAVHTLYAPDAYRMAFPYFQAYLQRALYIRSTAAFIAAWDGLFGMALLWLLYRISICRMDATASTSAQRPLTVAAVLAAMHFPLLWTLDWIRPNTLTCGFLMILSVWLLLRLREHPAWGVALLSLTVLQAFVRSDYPFCFGLAVILLALLNIHGDFGSKRLVALMGLGIVLVSGSVQAYLQFIRYPHLTYPPGVPAFMLMINLRKPYLVALVVATLPALLVCVGAWSRRRLLRSLDWLCLIAPLVYLPLWLTVASVMEPRVFFPMLVLFVPLAGHVISGFLVRCAEAGRVHA